MRHWSALASVSASNEPCRSGVPGRLNAPMSALVVTPTLTEYAIASAVPRLRSSKVWTARSAFSAAIDGALARDGAGVADDDLPLGEERAASRVGRGRTGEAQEDQHRVVGRRGVELGERRQALLGELRRVPSAHRGDELSGRDALRARLDRRLHLGDRRRRFERRVIAGADPEQDDVVVVVDEAGHDGPAAQIDLARARDSVAVRRADRRR